MEQRRLVSVGNVFFCFLACIFCGSCLVVDGVVVDWKCVATVFADPTRQQPRGFVPAC